MPETLRITQPIEAVFFDAAGTLFCLRESVGEGYARVARRHGFQLDPSATDHAFKQAWKAMPPPGSPIGKTQDRSEKVWWRVIVNQVLDQCADKTVPDRDEYFEELFAHYGTADVWRTYPETFEVLEALRLRDLPCFVLSNFDARLLPVLDGLGLAEHFQEIFFSGQIGVAKPDVRFFTHVLEKTQLTASTCLHVGDDPVADWEGAAEAGLQAFELNRSEDDLRGILKLENLPDFSD